MSGKIILTLITILFFGPIWFLTGYWAIEKKRSSEAYIIFLLVCGITGLCLGMIMSAIW